MISSEVQRTLVKSPPELWAELSDPAALARHLGELGEIRIANIEPERTVEWEAALRTGPSSAAESLIKPSGWGTRVTLVARVAARPSSREPELGPSPSPSREHRAEVPEPLEPEAIAVTSRARAEAGATASREPRQPRSLEPEPVPASYRS